MCDAQPRRWWAGKKSAERRAAWYLPGQRLCPPHFPVQRKLLLAQRELQAERERAAFLVRRARWRACTRGALLPAPAPAPPLHAPPVLRPLPEPGCDRRNPAPQAPFRVAAPKRGIIGNSRYAQQLRKQVVLAARDPTR